MTQLDTSRAPRGLLTAQALVTAVAQHGDFAERHYLELKSSLDLTTKRAKEKIAKFILGAGNRMPDVAATAFEGYAVMIIGVTKGLVTGIPPVEMMEISKVIQQYVGAAGPRWDVVWIPVPGSTNQVLLILVDPPKPGQGPFPCRANGESLTDGRIYIRAEGETREAKAEELDLLVSRAAAIPQGEVDFGIQLLGEIASITIDEVATVDAYVAGTRQRLIEAVPDKSNVATSETLRNFSGAASYSAKFGAVSSLLGPTTEPERRTEKEYLDSIDEWEANFRAAWPSAIDRLASSRMTPTVVQVTNRTTTFFHDVQVKLHLEGDVFALDYTKPQWAGSLSDLDLPKPPRIWGPRQRPLVMPNYANLTPPSLSHLPQYTPSPSVTYRNGGSVALELEVGELRPRGTFNSENETIVLMVADRSLTAIHGTWELTARDHNQVYTGEVEVPVSASRDFTSLARNILRLEKAGG